MFWVVVAVLYFVLAAVAPSILGLFVSRARPDFGTLSLSLRFVFVAIALLCLAATSYVHVDSDEIAVLNKIYGTTKQVNEAFTSGGKNSFKTVVMVEFPRAGMYSIGFLTGEADNEIRAKTDEKLLCVFIPTTPNPTSGFLVLLPEDEVTKLDMSVAEGVKFIISLGSISPDALPANVKEPAGRI